MERKFSFPKSSAFDVAVLYFPASSRQSNHAGDTCAAIPASVQGNQRKALAIDALAQAGLDDFFDRDPATLSGGQKARVALMRVLVSQPRALLLDEPFSKLDAGRRDQIRQFVFDEAKRQNLPTLLVTHDEADALAAGGKIIDLDG